MQQAESIAEKEKTIEELRDEIRRLKDHIRHSEELHVQDKENAVREYKKAFVFQRVLATVLAVSSQYPLV